MPGKDGDVTIPVPGDVVLVVPQETKYRWTKGERARRIVMASSVKLDGSVELSTNSLVRSEDTKSFRFSSGGSNHWWQPPMGPTFTLEISHHVRVLNVPRGQPLEIIVEE